MDIIYYYILNITMLIYLIVIKINQRNQEDVVHTDAGVYSALQHLSAEHVVATERDSQARV